MMTATEALLGPSPDPLPGQVPLFDKDGKPWTATDEAGDNA